MIKRKSPPSDYCPIDASPEHRLSSFERLTLIGGRELERALTLVAAQVQRFSLTDLLAGFDLDHTREAAAFYASEELLAQPERFFEPPCGAPNVRRALVHGLADGEIVDISFLSTYVVRAAHFRSTYERFVENRTVHARWWHHAAPARATLIGVHGWNMGSQRINSIALLPGIFYQLGFDVALFELPFHGRRAPAGLDGGQLFPAADVVLTNEAMGQVIHDLRSLRLFLEAHGARNVGWIGISLGAYSGCLWSGLDAHACAVALAPMTSMADAVWRMLEGQGALRELKRRGLSVELLRQVFYVHSPFSHCLKVAPERVLIVAGLGDRLVPAGQIKALGAHWSGADVRWFRGGHAASLRGTRAFKYIAEFLSRQGL